MELALYAHMADPQNVGGLPGATGRSLIAVADTASAVRMAVRIVGSRFEDVRFLAYGSRLLIGVCSILTESLKEQPVDHLDAFTVEQLCPVLGIEDAPDVECVRLAVLALLDAVQDHRRRQRLEGVH